jgi:hypothetical protein
MLSFYWSITFCFYALLQAFCAEPMDANKLEHLRAAVHSLSLPLLHGLSIVNFQAVASQITRMEMEMKSLSQLHLVRLISKQVLSMASIFSTQTY